MIRLIPTRKKLDYYYCNGFTESFDFLLSGILNTSLSGCCLWIGYSLTPDKLKELNQVAKDDKHKLVKSITPPILAVIPFGILSLRFGYNALSRGAIVYRLHRGTMKYP